MTDDARDYSPSSDTTDSGQHGLIERAKHVLSQDDRVLGVWLVGSFGRGTDDRFSDVDLWVVPALAIRAHRSSRILSASSP